MAAPVAAHANDLASALAAEREGRYEDAVREYREALGSAGDAFDAQLGLGRSLYRLKQFADAAVHLEAARALRPQDSEARRWLARTWLQLNRPTDVLWLLEPGSAKRKEDAWIHVLRGRAFDALNREAETIGELTRALELDPGAPGARFALGFVSWSARDLVQAERQFRVELAFNPAHRLAQFYLAEVLMTQNRLGEAEKVVTSLAADRPDCFLSHFALGKLEERIGNLEAAVHHYRDAIRLDPNSTEAHYRLGLTLRRAGRADEAQREFDRAHALRASDSRRAHQGMGLTRSHIPDFDL